jgi:hypothetical protein
MIKLCDNIFVQDVAFFVVFLSVLNKLYCVEKKYFLAVSSCLGQGKIT